MDEQKKFFESLWAPWRVEYYQQLSGDRSGDFLKEAANSSNDSEHLVVYRRKSAFVIMNSYPYTAGHLMVVPYQRVADLEELTSEQRLELVNLSIFSQRLLRIAVRAEAFNVGWNLGAAAGAGVDSHLHLHVVPRWAGDHNFMTVLGGARIIPEGLRPLYDRLREAVGRVTYPE